MRMKIKSFLQKKVTLWVLKCFGAQIAYNVQERNHRFLEEALELVQSAGCTKEEALLLVDYVFSRPKGEQYQEVGGVMVTLSALCSCLELDYYKCFEIEVNRIERPEIIEKIRQKQLTKPQSSPLPGKSE